MFPDLSPSGMSEFSSPVATDRDGVIRMFYVAMTRARKSLTICDRKSWNSVEIPLDTL
jgi:superfamily I DNA/RNA helicase